MSCQAAWRPRLEIDAAEIRIRSERRLGELLAAQKAGPGLNKGTRGQLAGRDASGGTLAGPPEKQSIPTLASAGIDKNLSSRAQELAAVPAVDHAELVWRKLAGATQQAVADELGWSRGQVSQYAMLAKLDPDAWKVVATTSRESGLLQEDGVVASSATTVAFTKGLLREAVSLTGAQQLELVTRLARGKVGTLTCTPS